MGYKLTSMTVTFGVVMLADGLKIVYTFKIHFHCFVLRVIL